MSRSHPIGILPLAFAKAVRDLSTFPWDSPIKITEREPPGKIAPYAAVIDAEVILASEEIASGRLILLHDPQGNEAWEGEFRCVTFAQAEVGSETIHDPFLAHVGWSWLIDALQTNGAHYSNECGTITTTASTPFGTKEQEASTTSIEIRASWTPVLDLDDSFTEHLKAWQTLLREVAGLPPEDHPTVVPMATARMGRR
ncbi:MAG: DUF3000 domain-containing protein [Propionibacteriaceae bacterium]|nr:DUF3000 domain-containing protein [Propionibacteriaceae bacterium]